MHNQKIYQSIIQDINWENWEDDKGGHFDLCEVLSNKLDWLREDLQIEPESEHFDTISQLKDLLSLLTEDKIKFVI